MTDNNTIYLGIDELSTKSVVDYIDNLEDDVRFSWDNMDYCGYLYCKDKEQAFNIYDEIAERLATVDWLNDLYNRQE